MGIYLPNIMKMPRKGEMLVIFPDGTSYVCFNGMRERLAQTTAFPVPPHGELIDRDANLMSLRKVLYSPFTDHGSIETAMLKACIKMFEEAPTIIGAEEGE